MKHTPGPWEYIEGEDNLRDGDTHTLGTIKGSDDYHICRIWNDVYPAESALYNARLISSAPELLEACKSALETCQEWDEHEAFSSLCLSLEHAIAKAEGK